MSVALIGPDGAGKTTVTRMLQQQSVLPFKYVYMGINMDASNVAMPTARLAHVLKRHFGSSGAQTSHTERSGSKKTGHGGSRALKPLWSVARLINRVADEWYRQLRAWTFQLRGFIVLYDRHFRFDFSRDVPNQSLDQRLHRFLVTRLYPRPGLVIFLDAPAEVLYARKGEKDLTDLEARRQAFLREGKRMRNFVVVNATQPLDAVYAQVEAHIAEQYAGRCRHVAKAGSGTTTHHDSIA